MGSDPFFRPLFSSYSGLQTPSRVRIDNPHYAHIVTK